MEFFNGLSELPKGFAQSAVTVGKFDGIHTGHREVLTKLNTLAGEKNLLSVVVTFDRNPLAILAPERCPQPLISNAQKRELLAQTGVHATLMLPFTREMSALSPLQFIQQIFFTALNARLVLAGKDFRFGAGGKGDLAALTSFGADRFSVIAVDDVLTDGKNRASSTLVREYLLAGRIREASQMLGRNPSVRASLTKDHTLDHACMEGFLPTDGYYSALLKFAQKTQQINLHIHQRTVRIPKDIPVTLGQTVEVLFVDRDSD